MEVLVVPAEPEEPDGPEVVRKTAGDADERDRLVREAEVLRAAADRGLAGLAKVLAAPSPSDPDPCLVTSAAAGPSLAVAAPLPILEVAGVVAEVAQILAGLHEVGLVHGSVCPSHVVLDGEGGAILVGLGAGGPVGAPSPEQAGGLLDPADDVAGWGALVGHLLDWSVAGEDEPLVALRRSLADRRPRRRRAAPLASGAGDHERRVLAALADQAQDPDPARRPAARSLATAVRHRVPEARMPGAVAAAPPVPAARLLDRLAAHVVASTGAPPADPATPASPLRPASARPSQGPPPARRRRRRPLRSPAVAPSVARHARPPGQGSGSGPVAGADPASRRRRRAPAVAALPLVPSATGAPVAGAAENSQGGTSGRPAEPCPSRAPQDLGRLRSIAVPAVAGLLVTGALLVALRQPPSHPVIAETAPPAPCAPASPPAADVDGDGCEEPVAWAEGVLHAGSARFALGSPGDAWAVGDWNCDGRRTPALLHEGTLAVFDTWPAAGAELEGRPVAVAAGATGLTVVRGPDGCDRATPMAGVLPAPAKVAP